MSERSLNKLSPELQEIVMQAGKNSTEIQRRESARLYDEVLVKIKAEGMQINEIADVAAFREKVKSVYETFRPRIGDEIMDVALTAVQ